MTVAAAARKAGLDPVTVRSRMARLGITLEEAIALKPMTNAASARRAKSPWRNQRAVAPKLPA